jgi:hypothetical protein
VPSHPEALALDVDDGGVVEQPVEDCGGDARIIRALGVSADHVLQEAGFLEPPPDPPELRHHLKRHFGLSRTGIEQALAFVQFLAERERNRKEVTNT